MICLRINTNMTTIEQKTAEIKRRIAELKQRFSYLYESDNQHLTTIEKQSNIKDSKRDEELNSIKAKRMRKR